MLLSHPYIACIGLHADLVLLRNNLRNSTELGSDLLSQKDNKMPLQGSNLALFLHVGRDFQGPCSLRLGTWQVPFC